MFSFGFKSHPQSSEYDTGEVVEGVAMRRVNARDTEAALEGTQAGDLENFNKLRTTWSGAADTPDAVSAPEPMVPRRNVFRGMHDIVAELKKTEEREEENSGEESSDNDFKYIKHEHGFRDLQNAIDYGSVQDVKPPSEGEVRVW
jgi:hypothetical protein